MRYVFTIALVTTACLTGEMIGPARATDSPSYDRDVRPILKAACTRAATESRIVSNPRNER
jgi:hypothetical protein